MESIIKYEKKSVFRLNVDRYNMVNAALAPYSLKLSCGVIVDTTLPPFMNAIVCNFDHTLVELNVPFKPLGHQQVGLYLSGGREAYKAKYLQEQSEARDWSTRAA